VLAAKHCGGESTSCGDAIMIISDKEKSKERQARPHRGGEQKAVSWRSYKERVGNAAIPCLRSTFKKETENFPMPANV